MAGRTGVDIRQGTVGENTLPGFGPVTLMKRPVRIRTQGVVGEKPPATRLCSWYDINIIVEIIVLQFSLA